MLFSCASAVASPAKAASDQLLNAVQSAVHPQCRHVIALYLELGNFLAPPLYLSLLGLHHVLAGEEWFGAGGCESRASTASI